MTKTNRYHNLVQTLDKDGNGYMKCFGNSMLPLIKSGSKIFFVKLPKYDVGDCVFCKVKGRFIDCHKIIKTDKNKGYLIANLGGHENGWTKQVYGKASSAVHNNKITLL